MKPLLAILTLIAIVVVVAWLVWMSLDPDEPPDSDEWVMESDPYLDRLAEAVA